MSDLRMAVLSTEYVKIPVAATKNGSALDPTSDTVQMAFTAPGVEPISGDWNAAGWETIGTQFYAICLVGPVSGVGLSAGTYDQWVKVFDTPEVPVKKATNQLIVF